MRILAMIAVVLVSACSERAPVPSPRVEPPPQAPAATPKPAPVPPGPRIETHSFALELAAAPEPYVKDQPGAFFVNLEGRGEWHVNQEFPIRVKLKPAAALGVAHTALEREDAHAFDEQKAIFKVAVKPEASGLHAVACEISFAMCTDENCVLETRNLALDVRVQDPGT